MHFPRKQKQVHSSLGCLTWAFIPGPTIFWAQQKWKPFLENFVAFNRLQKMLANKSIKGEALVWKKTKQISENKTQNSIVTTTSASSKCRFSLLSLTFRYSIPSSSLHVPYHFSNGIKWTSLWPCLHFCSWFFFVFVFENETENYL